MYIPFFCKSKIMQLLSIVTHIKGYVGVAGRMFSCVVVFEDTDTALRVWEMLKKSGYLCSGYLSVGRLSEEE